MDKKILGKNLRNIREAAKLTRIGASRASNIPCSTINNIEMGQMNTSFRTVFILLKTYEYNKPIGNLYDEGG